jgi:DNA-directed RNA polymerase subunit alpha
MIDSQIVLPSKPKIISEDALRGVYEIEGLYPGYGYTLGNSLRRIILSSLVGSAITSLKIEGVSHEFTTLPGVKEDVIMIILNLKKTRFKMLTDEPQKINLNIKGAKDVKASDLEVGGQVEVLNPEMHLATLSGKSASLNLEMTLERGLGFLSKETLRKDKNEIGLIFVDAAFTPINRVGYEVENMRVGDRTDFNRLRIHIETDGTITPHEALEKSIQIMISQLKAIIGFKEEVEESFDSAQDKEMGTKETGEEVKENGDRGDVLKTRIEDLELSARTTRALTGAGIRTVGGLARKKKEDLSDVEGLGDKGISEIEQALSNFGITLK